MSLGDHVAVQLWPGSDAARCSACGQLFSVDEFRLKSGRCPFCQRRVAIHAADGGPFALSTITAS